MSVQDGQYMWFYGASPEQQATFMSQGQLPPDYPMSGPTQTTAGGQLLTFGDGGGPTRSEYEQYRSENSGIPLARPAVTDAVSGARRNPGQPPLDPSNPYSYEYQKAHGPTSQNPDPTIVGSAGWNDPVQKQLRENRTLIANQGADTDIRLAQLAELAKQTQGNNEAEIARQNGLIDAQDPANAFFGGYMVDQAGNLARSRDNANGLATNSLGTYVSGLRGINAQNDATIGRLNSVYDDLSNPLVSNLISQGAIADPEALAGQQQALGQLQGAAGGSLDYSSQAAGAYADPKYLAMRDQGLEDLYGVSKGSKDVHVGQEDPEAYRAAMDALHQMGSLTTPQLTDAEKFLYEQARQAQEMDERAISSARMSDLRRRNMAGGGAELTQGALDAQRTSQNRVLSDLGANAQAVARATGMLQSYGQLGGALNSEANALATGNANRQLQALGMYEQGAEVAEQQSFQQEYDRGLAADKASSDNQSTRLGGMVASGNQANAMQDDAFNRGQAADVMSRYNKTFEQDERNALWGRTTDVTGFALSKNAQNSNNLSNAFSGEQKVIDSNYGRDRDVTNTNLGIASTIHGWGTDQLDRRLGVSDKAIGVNNQGFGRDFGIAGAQIGGTQFTLPLMMQNNTQIAGIAAGEKASDEAKTAAVGAAKSGNTSISLGNIANLWNGAGTNWSGLSDAQLASIGVSDAEAAKRLGKS